MKPRHLIFLALVLAGCSQPSRPTAPRSSATTNGTHSLDEFRFDWPAMVQDVVAKVGAPDRDIGSGIYILEYRLRDASCVWIGSADNTNILYVRHGTTSIRDGEVLYGSH